MVQSGLRHAHALRDVAQAGVAVALAGEQGDAELTARLGVAYVRGFQGEAFGAASVSTMTKHFPGGGPQKDGEDPHFAHGREQVYPGGAFEHHLEPFEALFDAGTRQVMPYYGMPVGTEHEEVGFGFNTSVITGLLRERFGFDGVVRTDWGLITDAEIFGDPFPARAWGIEHLSPRERMKKVLEAGADQFGGEACPELLVELVASGEVPEARIDISARRLLREKFALGLFDDPFVDEDAADRIVGNAEFRAAGEAAQRASITLLTNGVDGAPALPLRRGLRLYVEGIDREVAAAYGSVVDRPENADAAILRLQAPYEARPTAFENLFHSGSLDFPDDVVARVRDIAGHVPTVVDVFAERPAILQPIVEAAAAVTVNWGASATALLDVLTGASAPSGRLPFDLPRSMAAVEASPHVRRIGLAALATAALVGGTTACAASESADATASAPPSERGAVTVYLTRHGETILNALERAQGWADSPLTEDGEQLAVDLGEGLAEEGVEFEAAYSADMVRHFDTA